METAAPVWITRARPGAEATAAKVAALGFTPVVDPLLEVAPIAASIDLAGVAALAFTSVNGVRAFSALSDVRSSPVFAVGDAAAKPDAQRLASYAHLEGEYVAAAVAADAAGAPPPAPYAPPPRLVCLSLGAYDGAFVYDAAVAYG